MIPKIFHESKKYKSIILPKNIYPCIRCISAALKTVKNALKLPHCILKTMLVQPHKRIHEIVIDTFFLIYYFCSFSLCPSSINWSQQFADAHVTLKKTWGKRWDVRIKTNFQTCTWLISRQFKLKLSFKLQTREGFAPQPHWGHCEHINSNPPTPFQHVHFATVRGLATWPAQKWSKKILATT